MLLTILVLALAAAFFWAGYRAPPHPLQYQSKAGFYVALGLAALTGYFAVREARTVSELADLIDPVPEITDVTYVPTAAEVQAVSRFLAAVPGNGRTGTTQEQRAAFAEETEARQTEYWIVRTAVTADSVLRFYRRVAPQRGWTVETDEPPWLFLARDTETLTVFVSGDLSRPEVKVLYAYAAREP